MNPSRLILSIVDSDVGLYMHSFVRLYSAVLTHDRAPRLRASVGPTSRRPLPTTFSFSFRTTYYNNITK